MKVAIAILAAAATAFAASAATTFTVDDLSPGDGITADCYVVLWRSSAKLRNGIRPTVLESDGERAYVKVDGEVYPLRPVGQYIYESVTLRGDGANPAPTVRVAANLKTSRHDVNDEGLEIRDLKGGMKVTYGGQTQTIQVLGEYACPATAAE
ncbi:hypothetical protein [Asticcacaulis sp. AC460]|uniref:hypothetical protein n=1 Tax=Asticcacaulis sp. AC460 TaxID=1282360 RepID=UPI0012DDBD64|nr:hypothetical protein [Asticcacaulis sp. AC460]